MSFQRYVLSFVLRGIILKLIFEKKSYLLEYMFKLITFSIILCNLKTVFF